MPVRQALWVQRSGQGVAVCTQAGMPLVNADISESRESNDPCIYEYNRCYNDITKTLEWTLGYVVPITECAYIPI